jgi:hypothetical protein
MPEEGMKPNPASSRPGALAAYEQSDNPAIRRHAAMLREMIQSKAISAKDALKSLGALAGGDVKVGVEGMKEEGRNSRAEARMDEMVRWDSKRGVGFTRGGEVVLPKDLPGLAAGSGPNGANAEPKALQTMRWKVKTLVEAGVPIEDAQRIVAGGASMQVNPSTRARLAAGLMKVTKDDMSPLYPTLGAAMQAVDEALGANTARQGALPPAPDAMPGSLSSGASTQIAPAPTLDSPAPPAAPKRRIKFNERGEMIR